jgi:hypothetical protein
MKIGEKPLRWIDHTTDVPPQRLRSFGLTVGGIFALIGLWPVLWRGQPPRLWGVVLAVVLVLPALLRPSSLTWGYRIWMALGEALGWVNTRIILGMVFYGLFTPIGLLRRYKGHDPMQRQWDAQAETYRTRRTPRPSSHMTRQF